MAETRAEYVIVGAGSSGAALATRLAARVTGKVLLLEAGAPRDKDFWIRVPIGIAKILQNPDYVWASNTSKQSQLVGQDIYLPMGKLPGGSSSVNGMIYVRGDPAEFDNWRDMGCAGWGYNDLLPYFRRLESAPFGDDKLRGRDGPISVQSLAENSDELTDAFIAACQQAGVPRNMDYNGASYTGVGHLQLSTRNGRRCSTAVGYLDGPLRKPNLEFLTEARTTRILFDGKRAIGVEYTRGGETHRALADREVILSAGPIRSPQLLELSGVGNAAALQKLGVPVVHDLPYVGENFLDHLQSRLTYACTKAITLNDVLPSKLKTIAMGVKYMLTHKGIMATPSATAHANVETPLEPGRAGVKIQVHHLSGADRYANSKGFGLDPFSGFAIGFFQLRPASRGSIHISSKDPTADPIINPNYMGEEVDRAHMLEALRLIRKVMSQKAIAPYVARETRPGPEVADDDGLLTYIKTSGQTSWHPIGTCKMGADERSVVSPDLKVRGIEGLRVIDSSIMPTMPSSNTNVASIMIGEKGADLVLGQK